MKIWKEAVKLYKYVLSGHLHLLLVLASLPLHGVSLCGVLSGALGGAGAWLAPVVPPVARSTISLSALAAAVTAPFLEQWFAVIPREPS